MKGFKIEVGPTHNSFPLYGFLFKSSLPTGKKENKVIFRVSVKMIGSVPAKEPNFCFAFENII